MPIKTVCPKCKANLQVPDAMAGKQGKCKCGNVISIPAAGQSPVAGKPAPAGVAPGAQPAGQAAAVPNMAIPSSPASARNVGSLFDEITDLDFKSKAVVPRPDAVPSKRSETALLKKYTAADDFQAGTIEQVGRPGGLVILSILNFIGAAGCIGLVVVIMVASAALAQAAESVPLLKLTSVLMAMGIAGFILSATLGGGLLTRFKAFWWMAIIVYSINLCSGLSDALFDVVMPDPTGETSFSKSYGKAFGSLIVGIMILYYLCSPRVLKWYNIKTNTKVALAISLGIGLLVGAGGAAGTHMMIQQQQEVPVSPDVGQ